MEDRVEGNVLLSIANKCVRLISKRYGVDIDIYSLPLDNPKVYVLYGLDSVARIVHARSSAGILSFHKFSHCQIFTV